MARKGALNTKGKAKETSAPVTPTKPSKSSKSKLTSRPKKIEETPGQTYQKQQSAASKNPRDVFVLDADKLFTSERLLSGYLGLESSSDLTTFADDEVNEKILMTWWKAREKGFGVKGKGKNTSYAQADIFTALRGEDSSWTSLTSLPLPISYDGNLRGIYSWLVTMKLILENNPDVVLGCTWPDIEPVHRFHAEDWYRAYTILRWSWRKATGARRGANQHEGTSKAQMNPAQAVSFYDPKESNQRTDDVTMLSMDNIKKKIWTLEDAGMDEDTIRFAEKGRRRHTDDLTRLSNRQVAEREAKSTKDDVFHDRLQNLLFENAGDMTQVQKQYSQGREIIDAKQQEAVCTQIASKVRVLYPTPEDNITIVPSTESIKDLAARATESSDRALADQNLQQKLSNQAVSEGESLGPADNVLDAARKEFWEFQNRINSSSAVSPSYVDACTLLSMDPLKPSLESTPAATDKPQSTLLLLPHQVQAIAWLLTTCDSLLQGGILSDEMGLGKTVTALAFLVVHARRQSLMLSTDNIGPSSSQPNPPSEAIHNGEDVDNDDEDHDDEDHSEDDQDEEMRDDPTEQDTPHSDASTWFDKKGYMRKADRLVSKLSKAQKLSARIAGRKYKATLILGPSQGLGVWKDEKRLYFPQLTMKQFYSSAGKSNIHHRAQILGTSVIDLLVYLDSLPDHPSALLVTILSSYATWVRRSTYWDGDTRAARPGLSKQETRPAALPKVGHEDDDATNDDEVDMDEDELNLVHSFCPGVFAMIVGDEAQKLKSPFTITHKSVMDLRATHRILLTATPMINRPLDLVGLLSLFWNEDWATLGPESASTDDYASTKPDICGQMLSVDNINKFVWLVNPGTFKFWATPDKELGFLPASSANLFIPPILCLIQLKRTAASRIDNVPGKGSYRIGAEIPPVRWLTIELQQGRRELQKYTQLHLTYTQFLSLGFDEAEGTGLRNMTFHRKLCLGVMSNDLIPISSNEDGPAVIEKFYHKHKDHGATYFFNSTKTDPDMPVCRDRASMAYYLTRNSVKLSYIADLVHQICNKNGRKVIVFCDWPSTAWLVEILLMVLGFNVISIRAKHRLRDREAAIHQFNDKGCPVQVLVTSVKVSATSVNLQKDCSDTIFADVPSNAQSTLQAGARIIRIGQENACNIFILTNDHSYDQVLQATAARKMISIIAAYTNKDFTDAEIEARSTRHPELDDDEVRNKLMDEACAEDYRTMFGQRSRRDQWASAYDLTAKDDLPDEQAFREKWQLPEDARLRPRPRSGIPAKPAKEETRVQEKKSSGSAETTLRTAIAPSTPTDPQPVLAPAPSAVFGKYSAPEIFPPGQDPFDGGPSGEPSPVSSPYPLSSGETPTRRPAKVKARKPAAPRATKPKLAAPKQDKDKPPAKKSGKRKGADSTSDPDPDFQPPKKTRRSTRLVDEGGETTKGRDKNGKGGGHP